MPYYVDGNFRSFSVVDRLPKVSYDTHSAHVLWILEWGFEIMAINLSKSVWIFLWSSVAFLPLICAQDVCRWNWVQFRKNNGQRRILRVVSWSTFLFPLFYLYHNLALILLGFRAPSRCRQLVVVSCVSISKVCFVQERNWTGKELQRCLFCRYSTSVGAWWLPYLWVSYDNQKYHFYWTQARSFPTPFTFFLYSNLK